jgi:MFS family permease
VTHAVVQPAADDAEQRFVDEVQRHLPRNYAAHLAHGMLGQTGFRIVLAPTFIPAYVFGLTGSDLVVGVARACLSLGMLLSPLIGANLIEHKRKVLPTALNVGALMRVQILGMALAGFFLPRTANVAALCTFLLLLGFFNGMQSVLWNVLIAKVIPLSRRGALVGMRSFLGGVTASGVGVAGGYFIEHDLWGNGYASLFLLSFLLTASGLMTLFLMREPDAPSVREPAPLTERLREIPALFRSEPAYGLYFATRALGVLGQMASPYYVIYASESLGLSGTSIGVLTGAFLISQSVMDLAWGRLGDRRGFRWVLLLALTLSITAIAALMASTSFVVVVAVFAALGAGAGGFIMSTQTLVLELGSRKDLPMRIAVAQTGEQAAGVVAPLLGGVIASTLGYAHVFGTSIAISAVALLITLTVLPEPRTKNA